MMSRRSPRNHTSVTREPPLPSLRVKCAEVQWASDHQSLQCTLLVALESNNRWRRGLFSNQSSNMKARYYDEIARILFLDHPDYSDAYRARPGAFARAVKEKVEALPQALAEAAAGKARTRRQSAAMQVTEDSLKYAQVWQRHRLQLPLLNWPAAHWRPRLPLELQFVILHHFVHRDIEVLKARAPSPESIICACNALSPTGPLCTCGEDESASSTAPHTPPETSLQLDYPSATIACLVNRAWYAESSRLLYETVIVSKNEQYPPLFLGHGPMHLGKPGENTKVLKLLTPPQTTTRLCIHRATVPYVQFDFGSSRVFFDRIEPQSGMTLQALGRTDARIGALATYSVPLYQLTMCLEATKFRLFVSEENPVDPKDNIWQDLIAGHVASLRMMHHLRHLVLDATLYATHLLPPYFLTWCNSTAWRQVLSTLESAGQLKPMATFFDDTHVTTLTFVGSHVPTLAFLARISQAPKVKRINLAGWKRDDMPEDWIKFIKEDTELKNPLFNWTELDPDAL